MRLKKSTDEHREEPAFELAVVALARPDAVEVPPPGLLLFDERALSLRPDVPPRERLDEARLKELEHVPDRSPRPGVARLVETHARAHEVDPVGPDLDGHGPTLALTLLGAQKRPYGRVGPA